MKMTPGNDLKAAFVSLLAELGLFEAANAVKMNDRYNEMTLDALFDAMRKYKIKYSMHSVSKSVIETSHLPFLFIPHKENASVMRRNDSNIQIMIEHEQWDDVALDYEKDTALMVLIDKLPAKKQTASLFALEMTKRTKWYLPVFWLSLLASLTGLAVPLFTMSVYDRVIGAQAPEVLPVIAIGAFLAVIILVVTRLLRAKLLSRVSNNFARDLSGLVFYHLLTMSFMVLSRVGLTNHIARMRNAEKVRSLLSGAGGGALIDLPFASIALFTIALLSGWLVMVPIVMLVIYYLLMKFMDRYTKAASPTVNAEYQQALHALSAGAIQIAGNGDTAQWQNKFLRQCKASCRENFIFAKRNGLKSAVAHAMSLFTALATVFIGIFLVLDHSITAGALIACSMLIWRITGPAQLAFSSGQKFTMMKEAAQQFDRFMKAPSELAEFKREQPDANKAPDISLSQVTLRYGAASEPALAGAEVQISSGECVAVIGPNGSGKTSLLLSILGVVEPQGGFVFINDKNLKQYDIESLRTYAAFSPSTTDIYVGTLAENLRLNSPDASDEDLIEALTAAGASSLFDAVGRDVNAPIFKRGVDLLSAIESAHISLTRALLKKSKLILLDDPIANKNPFARADFIKTLEKLKGESTVVFTTHDPELIKVADKVIILDKGSVAFCGEMPETEAVTINEGIENDQA